MRRHWWLRLDCVFDATGAENVTSGSPQGSWSHCADLLAVATLHEPSMESRNPKPRNPKEGRNPKSEPIRSPNVRPILEVGALREPEPENIQHCTALAVEAPHEPKPCGNIQHSTFNIQRQRSGRNGKNGTDGARSWSQCTALAVGALHEP